MWAMGSLSLFVETRGEEKKKKTIMKNEQKQLSWTEYPKTQQTNGTQTRGVFLLRHHYSVDETTVIPPAKWSLKSDPARFEHAMEIEELIAKTGGQRSALAKPTRLWHVCSVTTYWSDLPTSQMRSPDRIRWESPGDAVSTSDRRPSRPSNNPFRFPPPSGTYTPVTLFREAVPGYKWRVKNASIMETFLWPDTAPW